MSQLQNKLQWSENQVNESKKAQDDLQDKLNSATEELKAQKEKLNEALASRSEADKNLENAKEKLAELQVCAAVMAYSLCTGPRMEPRSVIFLLFTERINPNNRKTEQWRPQEQGNLRHYWRTETQDKRVADVTRNGRRK